MFLILFIRVCRYDSLNTMYKIIITFLIINTSVFFIVATAYAQPYGAGKYNALVPYGGQTSITIATTGNVGIAVTPTTVGVLGTGTNTVTVTSTDVVGYKLYISSVGSSNMTNGSSVIPASANGSAGPLAINTWGYNTDASTNFIGSTTSNGLLLSATGPYETGNATTVTYGLKLDLAKAAGQFSTNVLYTAVPQTN
jgi:hypothetical protein